MKVFKKIADKLEAGKVYKFVYGMQTRIVVVDDVIGNDLYTWSFTDDGYRRFKVDKIESNRAEDLTEYAVICPYTSEAYKRYDQNRCQIYIDANNVMYVVSL